MTNLVNGNGLMDMFNMFAGGALERFSVFALGVIPYISASIVFQMMGAVVPSLQALRKEGEAGKRKMTAYTRRSEERRVGKECVSTCRSRWSPSHSKKKTTQLKQTTALTTFEACYKYTVSRRQK